MHQRITNVSYLHFFYTGIYKRVVSLKKINPDLKVLLSIGGVKREVFESVAASEETRKNLVESSKHYLETYNFDGIDVDWELPYEKDRVRNNGDLCFHHLLL